MDIIYSSRIFGILFPSPVNVLGCKFLRRLLRFLSLPKSSIARFSIPFGLRFELPGFIAKGGFATLAFTCAVAVAEFGVPMADYGMSSLGIRIRGFWTFAFPLGFGFARVLRVDMIY